MAYLSTWVQVRTKGKEDSELVEREKGNENSLQIALKGKDQENGRGQCENIFYYRPKTDPMGRRARTQALGRCWDPIVF